MRVGRGGALVVGGLLMLGAEGAAPAEINVEAEKTAVAKVVDASIGWFATKDLGLLESTLARGPELFIFHPDSKTTVRGYEELRKLIPFWMSPDMTYLRHEIRDLAIHLSAAGDAAWYSAMLDDCAEVKGQPSCAWTDVRWTGVLEKRMGRWVIVQMHFSFASDRPKPKEAPKPPE
jgi:ketosteroid isomerase-like protein